jgi:hypothetical protein
MQVINVTDGNWTPRPPAPGQFAGNRVERIMELAGRTCYDSVGKGRASEPWFDNIRASEHDSVYRHAWIDIRWPFGKDVWVNCPHVRVTGDVVSLNLDAAMHWVSPDPWLTTYLRHAAHVTAPLAAPAALRPLARPEVTCSTATPFSWFIECSRAAADEHARHLWRAGISMRSTRYCMEDGGPEYEATFLANQHLGRKVALGRARNHLKLGHATQYVFTCFPEQLAFIAKKRIHPAADEAIRDVVTAMVDSVA